MLIPQTQALTNPLTPLFATIAGFIAKAEYQTALGLVLPLLAQYPDEPSLLDHAATCYWRLGDSDRAIQLLQVLTNGWPQQDGYWNKLGAMAVSVGDSKLAEIAFLRALRLRPKTVNALAALNRITPFKRNSRRTDILRQQAKSKKTSPKDRATAYNALGQIEEKAGNYAIAFTMFSKSKGVLPGHYQPLAYERHIAAQKQLFQPKKPIGDPPVGARYVFVVGLPRSGTTLVESILTRHPDVGTIGEHGALPLTLRRARAMTKGAGTWDWFADLTPDDLTGLRAYFQSLMPDVDGAVVVNKLPQNCLEMGFANLLFPEARFVFMSRHPLDTGLSNLFTNFHDAHVFSQKTSWIGHFTRIVYDSLDDYADKLGPALKVQSYRALVKTPEPQIRALLQHVGLEWTDACLSPEQGQRIERTASLTQVRKGINIDGLGKWQRYEPQLAPMIDALGGGDWIDQWDTFDQSSAIV